MSNYYKNISLGSLNISNGVVDQTSGNLLISLNSIPVIEVKNNNAFLNSNRILTTNDLVANNKKNVTKLTFGSGIYKNSGLKYLRYCGNSESGYDTNLRVANIYIAPNPVLLKKIVVQKGFNGINKIKIPTILYEYDISGNFYVGDINKELGFGSHLYIEIGGDPSYETIVELYIEDSDNTLQPTTVSFTNKQIPVYDEVFIQQSNYVFTKYPLIIQ